MRACDCEDVCVCECVCVWRLTLGGDVCSAALCREVVLQLLDLLSVLLQLDLKLLHQAPEITTHTHTHTHTHGREER